MHFTSADDFIFRSNDQLVNQSVSDSKMQSSQSSSMSSTSNHTVSSLINAYNSVEHQQSVPSQISHSSYLNPSLIEVMSTLSSLNQLNTENNNSSNNNNSHSYPFFEFQKYFHQQQQQQQHFLPIQHTDTEKLKKSLNTESLTDMCLSLPISSVASTSSSSNISSPSNTPCKKRALSDVISKLRNQQTNGNEDDKNNSNSGDLEVDNNNETDSAHNNSTNNDYSTSVGDENDFVNEEDDDDDDDDPDADRDNNNNEEEDLNDLENENDLKKNSKKRKLKSKKSAGNTNCSSSSSSSSSSGIDMISNVSSNSNLMIGTNDFNLISAAEQISAIINNVVVNTTNNITSSPSSSSPLIQQQHQHQHQQQQQQQPSKLATSKTNNDQTIAKASINRINSLIMNTNSSVKKAQMDLLKLLERANLTQYMQVFSEQGGDDINQLIDADEKEFKEIVELVGMASKPLHVKRLRKAIDEYKNSNGKLLNDCLQSLESKTPMSETTNVTSVNKLSNQLPSVNSSSTNGSHQQLSSHNISKFLSNNDQISSLSTTSHQNNQNASYWPSSSSSSSSSVSSTSSSSSISSSSLSNCNPLSVQKICSSSNPTTTAGIVDHHHQQQHLQATNSATFQTPNNPSSVAALYPLYQLFNSKNVSNFIQQHQQQVLSSLVAPSQSLSASSNSHDNSTATTAAAAAVVASLQQNQKKKEETATADEIDGMDDDEEDAEDDEDDQDDTDEEYNEDEENDDYDDEVNMNNMGEEDSKSEMKQHSLLKKKNIIESKNPALAHNQLQQQQQIQSAGSNTKIEQNEKMIKKNKVIELYSKGERCVRKLSQLTGVPLTTVYRVIGKLKGINYNIPRGNGAGRKTILDAQDREILVEILNVQPRISRKALGKELEKRTGKSIHNSTLNRELCRLRHHGHNFAAVHAVAGNSFVNTNNNTNDLNNPMSAFLSNTANVDNQNYLKHFNTSRKSLASTSPSLPIVGAPNLNSAANNSANSKQSIKSKTSTLPKSKLKTEQVLDMENIKQISAEAKTLCATLSKSDTEMRPVSNTSFYNSINELCNQSFNPEHRLNRVKLLITSLLKDDKLSSNHEYTMYMHEACTQISLIKPTLLSRKNDLLMYARRILDQCLIFDSTKCETQPSKRVKLENKEDEEEEESDQNKEQQQQKQQNQLQYQQQHQQTANTFSSFYTALALHLQNQPNLRTNQMQDLFSCLPLGNVLQSQLNSNEEIKQRQKSLLENNEIQIKINQKYQDDLKSKLTVFSTNETDEQMKFLTEQLRKQLNEAVKKQSELLCEKIRLKTDLELTSNAPSHFNFASSTSINNNVYEDEQLDDAKSTTSFSSSRSSSRSGRDKDTSNNQNDIKSSRSMAVSSITQDQESSRNDNEDELAEITNEKNN